MGTIARTVKDMQGGRDARGCPNKWNPAQAVKHMTAALERAEEGHSCPGGRCEVCSAIIDLDYELRGMS